MFKKFLLSIVIIMMSLFLSGCGRKYTIHFDTEGGRSLSDIKVKSKELLTKPNEPKKDGYKFLGWYCNGQLFDFEMPITEDMTLIAHWEEIKPEGSISLSQKTLTLNVGDTATLELTSTFEVFPKLIWTSTNTEVVSVDENGNLQGIAIGEASINVSTYDGLYTQSCLVTVLENTEEDKDEEEGNPSIVSSVTISGNTKAYVGDSFKLRANVLPKEALNKEVIWQSSNPDIATIDGDGNVLALKEGSTIISVKTVEGDKKASIKLTIMATLEENEQVQEINIVGSNEVKVNESINLTLSNTVDYEVIWQSSDESVAVIDNTGKVTGIKEGSVTISLCKIDKTVLDQISINVIALDDLPN